MCRVDKQDQQQDFFISYSQADRTWAEWLTWELEAVGYTTLLQAWDMPAGTAFVHAMDHAVKYTRHVLLVLSPAYLRSAMAEAEWRPAFKADPSGEQRRLLPVRVEACEPQGLLADRVWIDLVGADEATARTRLREEVANALRSSGRPATAPHFPRAPAAAPERTRFPTALPPVWNVPYRRNPNFTGREELLGSLADRLAAGGSTAVTQVLQGAGGVGKTTLAVEYAYRHRSRFDTVWWVRAKQPATLLGDLADLALSLGLADLDEASQQLAVAAVRHGWTTTTAGCWFSTTPKVPKPRPGWRRRWLAWSTCCPRYRTARSWSPRGTRVGSSTPPWLSWRSSPRRRRWRSY